MMNRILKRPMFRMGGRSDDGIMSVRPGYANGGPSLDAIIAGKKLQKPGTTIITDDYIKDKYNKYLDNIYKGDIPDVDIAYGMQVIPPVSPEDAAILEFSRTQPEKSFELFKKGEIGGTDYGTKQKEQKKIAEDAGLDLFPKINVADKNTDTQNPQKKIETTGGETSEQSDKDLIKSYMDMFSEAMGESEEDISRQRYLELAKFGANLLAQPGGDLLGSVGRAAAPAIEGLSRSAADRSAANREIKLAGLKTAIAQMDNPTQEKIETLARMSGLEIKDVAKMMLDSDGGSDFELEIKALEGSVGAENAFKIAEQISDAGLKLSQVKPIPVDKKGKPKEGAPDGYYYDEDANIYKVEKGKPSILKTK